MRYRIKIAAGAAREIRRLPQQVSSQIIEIIDRLADNPRPAGVKKMKGLADCYRIRMGIYRIVYAVEDDVLLIEVVTVGHRKEVYKGIQGKIKRRIQ